VILINLLMSQVVLPRLQAEFLSQVRWGETSLSAVAGVWAVITALTCAIAIAIAINFRRLPRLRETMDAGANASVLPAVTVASMVGFGAVVAALPAFGAVRDWLLGIGGGPLVSLALATNLLAALTGSASGGLTIALDALSGEFVARASDAGLDPSLLHRVAVIGAGTLDILPHSGAIVTLLAVCGSTHRDPAVLIALMQANASAALLVALGYVVVNVVIGNIVEPRLMGHQLGLSSVVVLLSLLFWGWVLGPIGLFLSVPLTIALVVALDASPHTRPIAIMLGSAIAGSGAPAGKLMGEQQMKWDSPTRRSNAAAGQLANLPASSRGAHASGQVSRAELCGFRLIT
jgi:AI-2E family transporter